MAKEDTAILKEIRDEIKKINLQTDQQNYINRNTNFLLVGASLIIASVGLLQLAVIRPAIANLPYEAIIFLFWIIGFLFIIRVMMFYLHNFLGKIIGNDRR
ncbi:MAG: hypothetical protein KGH61_03150 [Candidatus Micrarchaeota archaeon]|nr:hypothetical protein [Candidatus Micrarchaeota archaeon]MDE1847920.1 hypothetical protein [Candidatus Micrarchaeota archaeon]MDE1864834.1 hypothetical protein [Candidatus Micrarchaeota archaeon]